MSRTWKKLSHHYTNFVQDKKKNSKRLRYVVFYKFHFRYIQIHRAFSAHNHNSEEPGIRTRLLPPDPWEDINIQGQHQNVWKRCYLSHRPCEHSTNNLNL